MLTAVLVLALSPIAAPTGAPVAADDVLTPHSVAELRSVSAAVLSPDARHVAYTLSVPRADDQDDGSSWSELWVLDLEDDRQRPFITGEVSVRSVRWTPDGRIAFLSKRDADEHTALYAIAVDGGEARRIATLETSIADYAFAPDGERVALVATQKKDEELEKLAKKGFAQEIYEEDWRPAEVWIADVSGADEPRKLVLEGSAHDVHWSPVADRLAVVVTPTPLVDDGYMRRKVVVIGVEDGSVALELEQPGKLGQVGWSPDGRHLATIAAADLNDPSAGRLTVAAADGGAPADVLPHYEGHVTGFAWQDAEALLYVADRGVWTVFERVPAVQRGRAEPTTILAAGGPILESLSVSQDGMRAAFVASSPEHPGEVYTMSHGDAGPRRRTHSNAWLADVRLAPQERVEFTARDGLELEGILIRPLDAPEGVRVPLILYVHGGPEAHDANGWLTGYNRPGQVAAAQGYAVFYVNYRGSTGRGVEFSKLSQGDPAGREFDDLVDAVQHLVSIGLVDRDRVGVTGGSYGGYATAWCATKLSEHFAAGVMFVGISDKVSKVGTTDIPDEEFHVHALKRVWDDWQFFLERSPIYQADEGRTPLLILHGKDDPRVDVGQSRELYRHLKLRGEAPVRLVLYPGEGHGNRKRSARLDYHLRSLRWFDHYLKGAGGEMPPWRIDYDDPREAEPEAVTREEATEPEPASAGQ
jgi:dipeptidyl aminopeptidase/acylaminoacyl peptidase